MDRKEYLSERKFLANLEANAYKDFDKTMLAISSGAIALSMAFTGKIECMIHPFLLVFSWLLWLTSIILQLLSFIYSAKAMREELVILTEQYKAKSTVGRKNKYTGVPSKLNLAALGAFGVSALLFIFFVINNLKNIIK